MKVILSFIYGLLLGSFANVCIWRIPEGLSIVKPGSFCPNCKKNIPLYYNIPLLSFIILKGRCKNCDQPINIKYPIIEFLTALITALWFVKFSSITVASIYTFYGLILVILSGIDFKHFYLPPQLTYPLMIIGLLTSAMNPLILKSGYNPVLYSLISLCLGGIVILAIRFFGTIAFKKEAMGLGDVKLMMGIAAFTGISGIFWTIFLASIVGSIVGLSLIISKKQDKLEYLPFGPYLSLGSIIYIHFSEIIRSYFLF